MDDRPERGPAAEAGRERRAGGKAGREPIRETSGQPLRVSSVLSALSLALDITEGQPEGHSVRNALIGMRLAREIQLDPEPRSHLFYALLLKDLGCSSNAAKVCYLFGSDDREAKRDLKTRDWTRFSQAVRYAADNVARKGSILEKATRFVKLGLRGGSASRELVEIRCERGADIARMLGFPGPTCRAIHDLDEHWDGGGHPAGKAGHEIPLLARILSLAQTTEVFAGEFGVKAAYDMARERSGGWFDPELVRAMEAFRGEWEFWEGVYSDDARGRLESWEPDDRILVATEDRVDLIARAFARVVDAKSPWTYRHSENVTDVSVSVARKLGLPEKEVADLRRAGLLHDIGKLGVSNLILDKDGKLTEEEFAEVQRHPAYSREILQRVEPFSRVAELAGVHHERLDGSGYHRGLEGEELSRAARALAVGDVFEALTADRPYRPAFTADRTLEVMREDVGSKLCPEAFHALEDLVGARGGLPWEERPPLPSEKEQAEREGRH